MEYYTKIYSETIEYELSDIFKLTANYRNSQYGTRPSK